MLKFKQPLENPEKPFLDLPVDGEVIMDYIVVGMEDGVLQDIIDGAPLEVGLLKLT